MKEFVPKRNDSLDVIRIAAVFAVVMTHCTAPFVTNFQPDTAEFLWGNLLDSISRAGVPLFLMISGALFLDERREITLKGIICKNIKNIAVITVVWAVLYSAVYNVVIPLTKGNAVHMETFIAGILNGYGHMWYLYMIMGIYVITPFLKKFVSKENREMVLFYILLSFAVQFLLPTVDEICAGNAVNWIDKFHLDFFGGYITYYLLGWYIVHVGIPEKRLRTAAYFIGFGSFLFIVLYAQITGDHETVYENIGAPVCLYSASLFLLLNNIKFSFREKMAKWMTGLSKLSFGTYIVHVIVLDTFRKVLPYGGSCLLYTLLCFAVVTCGSFFGVYVMSKIPVMKKLVKM